MSSSASRTFLTAIAVTFPLSCASVPDDLFSNGGKASASGGAATGSGGATTSTGGTSVGSGGASVGSGGTLASSGGGLAAGNGGGIVTGGSLATGGAGGQVATLNLELTISKPTDDCTWINGSEERLRFSDTEQTLEVGTDAEMGRAGLRFTLPIAAGSRIVTAILRVYRVLGETGDADTLAIQVFDVANVNPFDATHMHAAQDHASGGLWAIKASGMPVGKANQFTQSPDLAPLIQHVLDKPDWMPGGAVGFVLSPEMMNGWVGYADSSAGSGRAATLRLSYVPH